MGTTKRTDDDVIAAGKSAHALAAAHEAALTPRLPAGTTATLAADLKALGADPTPDAAAQAAPVIPLPEAMAAAVALISGVQAAVVGAKAKPAMRKAYGVSKGGIAAEDATKVLGIGENIVAAAQADPTAALGMGILPADVAALVAALADLKAAESAAKGDGKSSALRGKDRRAALGRVEEAIGRIQGAGELAFARDATTRAAFAALG